MYRRSRENHQPVAYKCVTGVFNGFDLCHPVAANIVIDRTLKCGIFRSYFRRLVVVTSAVPHFRDTRWLEGEKESQQRKYEYSEEIGERSGYAGKRAAW